MKKNTNNTENTNTNTNANTNIKNNISKQLELAKDLKQLEQVRLNFLGKKGTITLLNKEIKNIPTHERKNYGEKVNKLRQHFENIYNAKKNNLEETHLNKALNEQTLDTTLPGATFGMGLGAHHILTRVYYELLDILISMGFEVVDDREVEGVFYNFTALNMDENHPARDEHDTFFFDDNTVLRTHTSSVQIRHMLKNKPPIAIVSSGKVYRSDYDATHTPMFHQIEGLVVDKGTSMAEMKGVLWELISTFFGRKTKLRFRSSYFPFTEPSAEVDMACFSCNGSGCRLCGGSGWIEVLGCGMVDNEVFKHVDYDHTEYSGFAFGMGVERMAMLKYSIDDLRLFYDNNYKFLNQWRG